MILAKFAQKKTFFCAAILHPLLEKMFKSETTFVYFPQGFRSSKNFGHLTCGGKKPFKQYLKTEQTDRQTNRQTDRHTQTHIWTHGLLLLGVLLLPSLSKYLKCPHEMVL